VKLSNSCLEFRYTLLANSSYTQFSNDGTSDLRLPNDVGFRMKESYTDDRRHHISPPLLLGLVERAQLSDQSLRTELGDWNPTSKDSNLTFCPKPKDLTVLKEKDRVGEKIITMKGGYAS
jgi:hypothetical protein